MSRRHSASFVALVGALAVALAVISSGAAATRAAAHPSRAGLDTRADLLSWHGCGSGTECATLRVPVDYGQPTGTQVGIAVVRHRARGSRNGSLVVNFGGPGEAGTDALGDFAGQIPAAIRDHYDLVSFDPRGVGRSRPVRCVSSRIAEALTNVDPTPDSDADLRKFYDGTNYPVDLVADCVARNGSWLAELGSRNVARDLDRLRAALGDARLDYLGYSYGTVIGAVYAQMFPSRVGHLVLDSPVDLSSTALDELRGDAAGFENALDAFLADCARRPKCDFHAHGDPQDALHALQARFEQGLTLPTTTAAGKRSSRRAGVATFYTALIASLYDKHFGWPTLAEGLRLAQGGDGSLLQLIADDYNGRHDNGTYDNINEVIGAILCDDRPDPVPPFDQFVAEYHRDVAAYPFLGSYVGSTVLGCDPRLPRPAAAETLGDVRVAGTRPILVVGTTKDPATPYAGAEDLVSRVAGSRLLTFDSTEHTAYTKSRCIDDAVDAYLAHGKLPPPGTRCRS